DVARGSGRRRSGWAGTVVSAVPNPGFPTRAGRRRWIRAGRGRERPFPPAGVWRPGELSPALSTAWGRKSTGIADCRSTGGPAYGPTGRDGVAPGDFANAS